MSPVVILFYPLLPLLPFVTLVTPCYPCYPLFPLATPVTPWYPLLRCYLLLLFLPLGFFLFVFCEEMNILNNLTGSRRRNTVIHPRLKRLATQTGVSLPSPSRSNHINDIAKANRRETPFRLDHVSRNALGMRNNEA